MSESTGKHGVDESAAAPKSLASMEADDVRLYIDKRLAGVDKNSASRFAATITAETVQLQVILLGYEDDRLFFGHFGQQLSAAFKDIIAIADLERAIPNPFGTGIPSALSLRGESKLWAKQEYLATDLVSAYPFAISRPSMNKPLSRDPFPAAHEEWLAERGLGGVHVDRATTRYTPHQSPTSTTRYTTDPQTGSTSVDGVDTDGYSNDGYDQDGFDNDPDATMTSIGTHVLRATTKYTPHQSQRSTTRYTTDPQTGSTSVDGIDNDGYSNDGYDQDGFDNDPDAGMTNAGMHILKATTKYTPHQSQKSTTRYTTDPQTGSTSVDGIDNDGYSNDGCDQDGFDNDPE